MSDCFFCGDFVGEVNGDGGVRGRTVGNKDVCEQCLGELKHWLNGTLPRSPGMRERKLNSEDDDDSKENNSEENEVIIDDVPIEEDTIDSLNDDGPFSSKTKI